MPTINEVYRQANAAAEAAKSARESVGEFASDMSREAGKQFGRAQDVAVDAYDEVHAAIRRDPLTAVVIAIGLGFLFGVIASRR